MTLEDPYLAAREEVLKALNKIRELYERWTDLQHVIAVRDAGSLATTPSLSFSGLPLFMSPRDEFEWTCNELKNALRSIDWDLEDLEDTIGIVEKNPNKFKLDTKELTARKVFIEQTRDEVKIMKDKLNISEDRDHERTARQTIVDNSPLKATTVNHGPAKYSILENEMDSPHRQLIPIPTAIINQNYMMGHNDEHLDIMNDNTDTLKTVSRQINSELDEHQIMLDDFNEMEIVTENSKLDSTMKKMAKVLHMSNGNYNNYIPAPTLTSDNSDYTPKPCSLFSLSSIITNCFVCPRH